MYFTIYRDTQNQYRWNLKSDNHEPVASGESYLQKAGVLHAVALVNGKNNYRVDDLTAGLLDSVMRTQQVRSAVIGLGVPSTRPSSLAGLLGVNPGVSGLGGLLDAAMKKK